VATPLCGLCAGENRPAGIVGRVERRQNDVVLWVAKSKRRARLDPRRTGLDGWWSGQVLSHPLVAVVDVPDRLYAVCDQHGQGTVSTADVIGRRGRFIVDFICASA
jgi:hypothetical protein